MKSAILTINDDNNYGNRLQNYALTKLLSQYGETTTIYYPQSDFLNPKRSSILWKIYGRTIGKFRENRERNQSYNRIRLQKNLFFTSKYMPHDILKITDYDTNSIVLDNIDKIVIGSDQVWNYHFRSSISNSFAMFAPSEKVISYAGSFGVSEILDEYKNEYIKGINHLSAISVREIAGKDIVESLTDKKATVVLDPTLMLDKEDWIQITENFVDKTERYILTYFLGKPNEEQEAIIVNYAKEHNLKIKRILDKRDLKTYEAGPQDFVELFENAEMVFTDSYHACAFSIIFNKQFKVFSRNGGSNMNSRMETLFKLFNINLSMEDNTVIIPIDYTEVNKLLDKHKKESFVFLERALGVKG